MMSPPTVGSLFSGIGGLDLGLERAGFDIRWQSEIEPYCCKVLKKHWPDVPNLGDVTEVDWSSIERVDLICGGYPCQPFSTASAGARKGADDARHLWPFMRDALGVLRPRYALMENVAGHLSLGFGDVLADLAALGYDCEWDCVPAVAVGAPHRRDRVFILAHADPSCERVGTVNAETQVASEPLADSDSTLGSAAGSPSEEIFGPEAFKRLGRCRSRFSDPDGIKEDGSSVPWGERGIWAVEPDVGRVAHGIPHRVDRLRALGNAVVPQVAQFIGEQLLAAIERAA